MTDADLGRAERDGMPSRAGLDRTAGLLLGGLPVPGRAASPLGVGPARRRSRD
jgi:hypothetical protein